MAQRQPIVIPFPLKGISEGWALRRQPEGTTPAALNVRSFGEIEGRLRGGQRSGISPYHTDVIEASKPILGLSTVARAIAATTVVAAETLVGEDFTQANGVFDADEVSFAHYYMDRINESLFDEATPAGKVRSNTFVGDAAAASHQNSKACIWKTSLTTTKFVISATVLTEAYEEPFIILRAEAASGTLLKTEFMHVLVDTGAGGTAANLMLRYNDGVVGSLVDVSSYVTLGVPYSIQVVQSDETIQVSINGVLLLTETSAAIASNAYVGFGLKNASSNDNQYVDNFTVSSGKPPDRLSRSDIILVCNGSVYSGDKDSITKATGGDAVMNADRRVGVQGAFGTGYLCDGTYSHYYKIDTSTKTVSAWTPSAGTLPRGSVDDTLACRIIALYRGRVVMSGLVEEGHNWFMSAAGAPLDWDYAPTTTSATTAVAGNNADAGLVGDVITALIPYSDDLLIFGGDHTIWMLRGDPAAGGVIDAISYQTGVAGPASWCFDPHGVLYFFGGGAAWRMPAGAVHPEPLSHGRLDRTFGDIDIYNNRVSLDWDVRQDGMHLYVMPLAQPSAGSEPTHYFWDRKTDSWWMDTYPNAIGPTISHYIHDPEASKSGLLVGGWDGFLRVLDDAADDDDGTAMESYVDFAPLVFGGDLANSRLTEVVPLLAAGSGAIRLEAYAADSAEAVVVETTPRFVKVLGAGRNRSVRQRINGNAIRLRLSNPGTVAQTWALESLTGIVAVSGKTRQGHL